MKIRNALLVGSGCLTVCVFAATRLTSQRTAKEDAHPRTELTQDNRDLVSHTDSAPIQPLINGNPKSLIVVKSELPGDFAVAGGESQSANEYTQVYFNPHALLAKDHSDHGLLGVIVNLTVLESAASADSHFVKQGGLESDAVMLDVQSATPGAVPISAERQSVAIQKADRSLAFRVQYVLQGTNVIEYRYRVRIGNVIANLIISNLATSDGSEPRAFAGQSIDIVKRQVARLVDARG